ncbi:hypothetical protein TREMEDRAFT_38635 [Tremella mesenterica DSM 1558]|uniref:uncharacterized protein n=1 Tax=Tremella mesenterica (strain ATCC 24925 / CBS 8224 / DSM 1558 / NBRC 9311 / NRRL Y-6157 / RJB 2259-6 / UBC 559-6) TaxID=578456 RepID=UPI0003F4A232|nr:uncharacterized protein TREMEDRAFT_38635 [Tremella mesenterica DSM 1558]EIW69963.1 hypothetical protein TREMEDRAFT_38635 [Tremella mesenterica DSM 1558]
MVLVGLAAIGMSVWTGVLGKDILDVTQGEARAETLVLAIGMVVVWMYLFARPLFRPPTTPPWPLLTTYALLWTMSIVTLCLAWYTKALTGHSAPWATKGRIILEVGNLLLTSVLVYVVGGLRLATPEAIALLPYSAPDDLVTLSSWLSFRWVNSFIALGSSRELQPEDVPKLSLRIQTAICFERFREIKASSLLWQVLKANKLDMAVDCLLTIVSVVMNYAAPFFLKRILDGLPQGATRALPQAYVYTFLALMATVLKAVSDLLHLWHSRRATTRIKAELIAAIYDKALKRRDASGVISAKDEDDAAGPSAGAPGDKKPETKKSNAESGKVVNLMAGDANRIANMVSGAYWLYSNPFEIIIAASFLFNLLGWSAFAGIIVLAIAAPLNTLVSKRSIAITKDLLKARDKRITVMNELIGAIQFIKFFAWTEQWKGRAADARNKELKQLIRSSINSVIFSLLWSLVPILVTLLSFFCYIVIEKRELTVSVAFTSVSLFTMLRMPLNILPTFIVMILNAMVSVKRIDDFLQEDEVPDWVSSIKRKDDGHSLPPKIGFENATLRWNSGVSSSEAPVGPPKPTVAQTSPAQPPSPSISDGTTAVSPDAPEPVFTLADLNVDFPIGKLTIVTGPTGSGKTAVLIGLLGEMELAEGRSWLPKYPTQVDSKTGLRNSVAYAAQTPWLQQKSIKDNILFGEELDQVRYEATLDACALLPDLEVLEDGDATEIGAKGVSLSGGQKARVALARAVYSYTQHLLIDDPLAAVDSHTARHLTDKCLSGPLLKGRTVIIVSHHVELLLPTADYIIRMLDGRIDVQGTPADLKAAGDLNGLIALEQAEATKEEPVTTDETVEKEIEVVEGDEPRKAVKTKGPGKKLVQDEERAIGNVKWETYKLYITAATYHTWFWIAVLLFISQFTEIGERFWLKVWGEAYTTSFKSVVGVLRPWSIHTTPEYHHSDIHQHFLHHSVLPSSNDTVSVLASIPADTIRPSAVTHPSFYLTIYAAIVLGDALINVVSSGVGAWSSYRAAKNLHNRLLDSVLRGTIRFFTTTPVGRIVNRFSKDIETIDSSLNSGLRTVIIYIASLFGAIGVVAVIVPWFLLPAAVISYLYWHYAVQYLRVGRSLRRLEATSRSPIFSGFAELLDGVVSVRAFSVERRFMKTLCQQVDETNAAFYYVWMVNRWLLLRFDLLGALSVFFTTLFALSGAVPAGSAGMAILSAQGFVSACYWVSRFWGQLEMDFNSVERVQEYLHLPQEPPSVIPSHRPPAYWPSSDSGKNFLVAEDVEIKYAPDLPTVFKGSFTIAAGEKIGLIGRTGSGKSTLAMSMLRFTEPHSGRIILDGIDITSIGVDDLRSRITYIPQDAVLFSGTVRDNLDPFNEHTDEELQDALRRVNVGGPSTPIESAAPSRKPSARRLNELVVDGSEGDDLHRTSSRAGSSVTGTGGKAGITLGMEVSSGGSNFSQGQRQLIAMARALLRRSSLIIMDEATASVDFETDEAIQAAIRTEFKDSTLLTIAHRLSTVIDYDRVLILSGGKVEEFARPIELLRKSDSLFKYLCEQSGQYKELYQAAEKKA